jgi:predicted SAM-dependent methyltransferase
MCDMMAGNVDLIHKHHLHEHEYAREITDASVECYKEARTLQIKLEARICAEKRGAA